MNESLHGREGLIAALASPEDWEARAVSANWSHYTIWRTWDLRYLEDDKCEFRRIEKPREAMVEESRVSLLVDNRIDFRESEDCGALLTVILPFKWLQKEAQLTIREIVPDAAKEPNWKAKCEIAESSFWAVNEELEVERAAHEKTKHRAETAEAKLSELYVSAKAATDCRVSAIWEHMGELVQTLKRCAPEGKTDG